MTDIEVAKRMLAGIFQKNYFEDGDIDDCNFIPLIKSGIESAADGNEQIFNELLEHTLQLYIEVWLSFAARDEEEYDHKQEEKDAKKSFWEYF